MKNLLENKIVLYIVFFLSLSTIFGYMVLNNYAAVLFFILMAFLTNYFSKNMIVILGCAILGTHLLAMLDVFNNVREGFKEGKENATSHNDNDNDDEEAVAAKAKEAKEAKADAEAKAKVAEAEDPEAKADAAEDPEEERLSAAAAVNNDVAFTNATETFANKKKKKKTGFNNMYPLNPADITPNVDNILTRDDKAKAKERAYDIVEEKLGKDKLQNMNIDTKELIDRQKELMEEMKKITPILSQTMGMMGNMDLSSLTSMFDKITDMMPSK